MSANNNQIHLNKPITTPQYVWENPGKAFTREGRVIDTTGSIWLLFNSSKNLQLNWDLVTVAPDVKDAMRAYLFHVVEARAASAGFTVFNYLKKVINDITPLNSLAELSYAKLESALATLRADGTAWKFGHTRRWYEWCCNEEIPGFDSEICRRLNEFVIPTNATGEAVRSRDPEDGPFNDQEHHLIRKAVEDRQGPLKDRVCVMLLLELGARPTQMVLLKEEDLHVNLVKDGGKKFYSLDVIRLKQGHVGEPEKKERRISNMLGEQIEELIEENHKLYGDENLEKPLLRSTTRTPEKPGEDLGSNKGRRVRLMTRDIFTYRVKSYAFKVGLISPRTNQPLIMFPYRFRYTFGTRHANQGTPAAVLAELLDHSGTESVRVYTTSTSAIVDHLNEALGSNDQYVGIIGRFLGKITSHTGHEPPNAIVNGTTPTLKNLGGLGLCGANYLCSLYPPLSCYVCPKFEAWKDAPHKQLLSELETYVRQLAEANSNNPSDRIPKQLDETMIAIKTVLAKIAKSADDLREHHE